MLVLVGDLRGDQEPDVVVGRRVEERRQVPGDAELCVEAVREDPQQRLLLLLRQRREAGGVLAEVELMHAPVSALPVVVERIERPRALLERDQLLLGRFVDRHVSRC